MRYEVRARPGDDRFVGAQVRGDDVGVVQHGAGLAVGDDPALVHGHQPVGDGGDERHVVLDHEEGRPEPLADAQQQRAERLGLALGDAARRLVEQHDRRAVGDDAGQVDDAAGAGRQLAHELRPEGAEAEQLDELVDPPAHLLLGVERRGQVQGGRQRVAHLDLPLEGDGDRLLDGERGEQPGVLERAPEAAAGPGRAGLRSVMSVPPSTTAPPSAGVKPETTSNSVVLPAPLGPMMPTISPGATARSTRSTARMPPKLRVSSRTCERRAARRRRPRRWRATAPPPGCRCPPPAWTCTAAAAPSRNTERRTSGRSSSSVVGPWKRISPFSMK